MRVMRVPSPGWLSASMRPPWASAMVWTMERPRPLPGLHAQVAFAGAGSQGYPLAFWSVLDRVVHEGEDRLFHPRWVDPDEAGLFQFGFEGHAVFRGERRGPVREAFDQDFRLHGLHAEGWCRRLRTREEQQILDHPRHRR